MTKKQFKKRWESNAMGGGITMEDIAKCAILWGICSKPRTKPIDEVRYKVLKAANTIDYESFNPKILEPEKLDYEGQRSFG